MTGDRERRGWWRIAHFSGVKSDIVACRGRGGARARVRSWPRRTTKSAPATVLRHHPNRTTHTVAKNHCTGQNQFLLVTSPPLALSRSAFTPPPSRQISHPHALSPLFAMRSPIFPPMMVKANGHNGTPSRNTTNEFSASGMEAEMP
ncbi:hypothetical protein SESBI_23314 [Sesbania bispinosa]|nr:hypothetical protein SESBI_23314 [Sesbania bispinosa]